VDVNVRLGVQVNQWVSVGMEIRLGRGVSVDVKEGVEARNGVSVGGTGGLVTTGVSVSVAGGFLVIVHEIEATGVDGIARWAFIPVEIYTLPAMTITTSRNANQKKRWPAETSLRRSGQLA
jgi:hypothetical protein